MGGGLRQQLPNQSTKSEGSSEDKVQPSRLGVSLRKRRRSSVSELDKKLQEEINFIQTKIKSRKYQEKQNVQFTRNKSKDDKENQQKIPYRKHRKLWKPPPIPRLQEMVNVPLNCAGHDMIPPIKQPGKPSSGFWIQKAKTPNPPLSFLCNTTTSEPSLNLATRDKLNQCVNTREFPKSFMHDVDRLFKKARSESSKSKPKLKVNIEFRDKLSSIQPSDQ